MEAVLEFVIIVAFVYWAFPSFFSSGFSRINKMVDIVTNQMFDVFNRFSTNENRQTDPLTSIGSLKRFSRDQKNLRKLYSRSEGIKLRESQLCDIKETAPEIELSQKRPLMGLSCDYCTKVSRDSLVHKTTEKFALKNILDYRPDQPRTLLQRTFSHLHQVYQLKKFHYPQVAELVLKDERLKHAIEKTTIQQFQDSDKSDDEFYQKLYDHNKKRARKLLFDMRSTLSDFLLRFTSWILYKLLPCFLSCVVAHPGQIKMLKEAGKTSLPLIFLPLHRSHLDYILISFILLNNNVRSPLVAAGDNLRIPFFGSLLRGLGAFFIKRRIDPIMGRKDHVYKAVLHTYMNECLKAGHNIEFFLEGGRTRTGKPCMPKYGILSIIVEAFMDGTIEDALLVPVSVNYEKLVDGNFVREQLGQPKEMETFGAAIKGIWHVLNSDYGMMRIDFNQPFSLRELVKTFNTNGIPINGLKKKTLKSNPSTTSLYGTDVVSDEHKSVVESVSKHVIYDCAKSTSVMSTNALAFLLLTKYRNGATLEELVKAFDDLRNDLTSNRRDIGFNGDSLDVINYAIDILGPGLVRKERNSEHELIRPISILPNVIELSYYSNTLVTHYALDSIIAISINITQNAGNVSYDNLIDTTLELCNIFQYEFILCKPCQNLEHVVIGCIDDLIVFKQIFLQQDEDDEYVKKSKKIAQSIEVYNDDEEDFNEAPSKVYNLNPNSEAKNYLKFLESIVMPLIETYSVTACTLDKLIGRSLLENELINEVLEEAKLRLGEGQLSYDECVSVDPIKNALKLYQKWEYLECHQEDKLRLYHLRDNHDNPESVASLYEKINKFTC